MNLLMKIEPSGIPSVYHLAVKHLHLCLGGGNSSYLNDNTCSVNFQASINLMLTRGIIKYERKGIAIHEENSTTGLIFQQILETVIWDFVQFF